MLWCATARRQHQLPRCPFRSGPDTIIPSTAVRDLGIYIDSDLSIQTHVRSVAGCFAVLRQLHSIRQLVPSTVYQSLVVALSVRPMLMSDIWHRRIGGNWTHRSYERAAALRRPMRLICSIGFTMSQRLQLSATRHRHIVRVRWS